MSTDDPCHRLVEALVLFGLAEEIPRMLLVRDGDTIRVLAPGQDSKTLLPPIPTSLFAWVARALLERGSQDSPVPSAHPTRPARPGPREGQFVVTLAGRPVVAQYEIVGTGPEIASIELRLDSEPVDSLIAAAILEERSRTAPTETLREFDLPDPWRV